nr:MAG TPA: hypothetical protein [Caudoviricetes sp.]
MDNKKALDLPKWKIYNGYRLLERITRRAKKCI